MSETQFLVVVSLPFLALLLACVVEVLRRPDLTAGWRILWVLALVVIPVVGLFAYLVVRPPRGARISGGGGDTSRAEAVVLAAERRQRGELDDEGYRAELAGIVAAG